MKNAGYKSLFCIYVVSNAHFMFVFKLIIGNELQLKINSSVQTIMHTNTAQGHDSDT